MCSNLTATEDATNNKICAGLLNTKPKCFVFDMTGLVIFIVYIHINE